MAPGLAVLVDGDNIGGKYAAEILAIAAQQGSPTVVRVYADLHQRPDWEGAPGYRLIHSGSGKNSADLLLTIDAMELALTDGMDQFLIASSDGDFTHLSQRLREYGVTVIGVGEAKAPRAFRACCRSFTVIGPKVAASLVPDTIKRETDLDRKIRDLIGQNSKNGAGMRIADLAPQMHSRHGTRISTYPERRWHAYLAARPHLFEVDPRGSDARVRFKPGGFARVA